MTVSAGLTMVQVVHLNLGSELGGPHNFTEIIFIHTACSFSDHFCQDLPLSFKQH